MTSLELVNKIDGSLLDLSNYIGEQFPKDSDKVVTAAEMNSIGDKIAAMAENIEEALSDYFKEH